MIKIKVTEAEHNFIRSYQMLRTKHRVIVEGLVEWFEVLEAIEMEGNDVDKATIRVEHDLFENKVRFKHVWKLKDAEE